MEASARAGRLNRINNQKGPYSMNHHTRASALNSPSRVLQSILNLPRTIAKIDLAIEPHLEEFCVALSGLYRHAEAEEGALASVPRWKAGGAEVCMNIMCAATEFETGWNALRLANPPAALRQTRVGCEFVGIAGLYGFTVEDLLRLNPKLKLVKFLQEDIDRDLRSLLNPKVDRSSGAVQPARLPALEAYKSFLAIAQELLGLREDVQQFREYQRWHHHSAAHGDPMLAAYHFEGFEPGKRVGAYYSPERIPSYREGAERLTQAVQFMVVLLNKIVARARVRSEPLDDQA